MKRCLKKLCKRYTEWKNNAPSILTGRWPELPPRDPNGEEKHSKNDRPPVR